MPRYNVNVAFQISGDGSAAIQAELRKLQREAEQTRRELAQATAGMRSDFRGFSDSVLQEARKVQGGVGTIQQQLKSLKTGLGKGFVVGIALDAIGKSLDSLAHKWAPNNEGLHEFTGSIVSTFQAVRQLDAAGVGAGLGQMFGSLLAMNEQWARDVESGTTRVSRALEEQRNAARVLAHQGFDVAGKSAAELRKMLEDLGRLKFDLAQQILGDPKKLEQDAAIFASVVKGLETSGQLQGGSDNFTKMVKSWMDAFEDLAQSAPAEIQRIADAYGILSTRGERAAQEAEQQWERQKAAAEAAAKKITDAFQAVARESQAQSFLREQLEATNYVFEEAELRAEAFQRVLSAGADPASAVGKKLYEASLATLRFSDSIAFAKERQKEFATALKQMETALDDYIQKRNAAAETKALEGGRRFAEGVIDIGRLREEIEWEKKRAAAVMDSRAALIEWAVAKAKADYIARTNATPEMVAEFERLTRQLFQLRDHIDGIGKSWKEVRKEINEGFVAAVGQTLVDAANGFLERMEDGLIRKLPSGIQTFAKALLDAANQWLLQMLQNIIQAKAAAKGIGAADGGSGGSGGSGWLGTLFKLFKGSGSGSTATGAGLSTGAIAGIAAFAVVAAVVAINRHQRSERDKQRFSTGAGVTGFGGGISSGWSGRLDQTGKKVADAMQALFTSIQETTRSFIDGVWSAQIKIRNDKKAFIAEFKGQVVGTFRTMNEAIVAAAKAAFSTAEGIDPRIRQVLENFKGTDPEALAQAVQYVQGIVDAVSGLTEVEKTLQSLHANLTAMVQNLQLAGVAFQDALALRAQSGLQALSDAWDQISGRQRSPQEEKAMRERQKALLLDKAKLERIDLLQAIAILKAKAAVVRGGAGLAREEIRQGQLALMGEGRLARIEFELRNNYLDGRAQFVQAEAGLFDAELAILEKTLADLDKLIADIERTPIRLGGRGGGRGGVLDLPKVGGGGSGGGRSESNTFWQLLTGQMSSLSPEKRLQAAQSYYQQILQRAPTDRRARDQIDEARQMYLEAAQGFFGNSGPYAQIFEQVMRETQKFGAVADREHAARKRAITELFGLGDAANQAARVLGFVTGASRGGAGRGRTAAAGSGRAANANSPLAGMSSLLAASLGAAFGAGEGGASSAGALGGGMGAAFGGAGGGGGAIVAAVSGAATRQLEQLERIASGVERQVRVTRRAAREAGDPVRRRRGGGGDPPPPTPGGLPTPNLPPAGGGVIVRGGGRVGLD